uniref:Cysteine rich secreted protein n=1 Tax=Riptortus pedestris TaxID=329032 RepID=R4WMT6_RIPPE|nr:cysteine rich secreted protein [Riptortus pedestris]
MAKSAIIILIICLFCYVSSEEESLDGPIVICGNGPCAPGHRCCNPMTGFCCPNDYICCHDRASWFCCEPHLSSGVTRFFGILPRGKSTSRQAVSHG